MAGNSGDYLADTHALLFFWGEPKRLSKRARGVLRDPENRIFVSPATAWELATKVRIGKLPLGQPILDTFGHRLLEDGFVELAITTAHALRAGSLPGPHRDPFDRMLAAQSILEGIPILSADSEIEGFGAERIW